MMDLVQLEIKEKVKVFGLDFFYMIFQKDLFLFVQKEKTKKMLKNISNDGEEETMAIWSNRKTFSKIRPIVYKLSDSGEMSAIDTLIKGEQYVKKLYENIEDIHIKGGVSQLTEMVTAMDVSLQNMAENTEQLTMQLIRYSASNKGSQYERVVNTTMRLRDELFEVSTDLNEMQNQIVAYQNKIYRYEEMSDSAAKPYPYLVNRNQNVNVETAVVQFNRTEMMNLVAILNNYAEKVFHQLRTISQKKNSIAMVWCDSQYDDFAEFIDTVSKSVLEALKEYKDYVVYLNEKIKELS